MWAKLLKFIKIRPDKTDALRRRVRPWNSKILALENQRNSLVQDQYSVSGKSYATLVFILNFGMVKQ